MGVLYLAAYLRKYLSAEVRVLDIKDFNDPSVEVREAVRKFAPHMLGISGLTCESYMLHEAARLARLAIPEIPVIAGGPYPSSDPNTLLADRNIDVAVIGEGEETLLELARTIRDKGPAWKKPDVLRSVHGIVFRGDGGELVQSPARKPIESLDDIPGPAWDTIDPSWYWTRGSMSTGGVRPYMPVFTTRGCPFSCTYCHKLFSRAFRARTSEHVIDEILNLNKMYGVNDFEFLDDSINIDRDRFRKILEGLASSGLKLTIHFPNGLRTDLLEEDDIRLIKRVGAGELSVAVETASPRLQKMTRKNLDLDKVSRNIDLLAQLRVFTRGFFMLGYPTETEAELLSTIDFAAHSQLHLASFHITNPFPGTQIYDEFKALGKLREDVHSIDYEYVGAPFNGSSVSDERFHELFKLAYSKFYFRPGRIYRIARDIPYASGYYSGVISLLSKYVSFRRIQEALPL